MMVCPKTVAFGRMGSRAEVPRGACARTSIFGQPAMRDILRPFARTLRWPLWMANRPFADVPIETLSAHGGSRYSAIQFTPNRVIFRHFPRNGPLGGVAAGRGEPGKPIATPTERHSHAPYEVIPSRRLPQGINREYGEASAESIAVPATVSAESNVMKPLGNREGDAGR